MLGRFLFICYFLAVLGLMLMAVAAVLGFAHPSLDTFNHIQPALFFGTLTGLVLTPFVLRQSRWQSFIVVIAATGFIASSVIVIPELVNRFRPLPGVPGDDTPVYKLMTHNVFGQNYAFDRVIAAIEAENPDIITFQEYFAPQRRGLHTRLDALYPYSAICMGGKRENIAIYARIPFSAEKDGACADDGDEKRVSRIFARFAPLDGAPFTVATTHLDWPGQISQLRQGTDIMDGFERAFARQKRQFAQLAEIVSQETRPFILTADFNSTSWSYALRGFAYMAGLDRQDYMLLTYPYSYWVAGAWRAIIPFLPLDHVMTKGGVIAHDIYRGDPAGSDHAPVITVFSVEQPAVVRTAWAE